MPHWGNPKSPHFRVWKRQTFTKRRALIAYHRMESRLYRNQVTQEAVSLVWREFMNSSRHEHALWVKTWRLPMKLLSAKYVGLEDGLWTKIEVKLDMQDSKPPLVGELWFENDGRDLETDERLEPYFDRIMANFDDIYNDATMKVLEPELAKGTAEYEAQ